MTNLDFQLGIVEKVNYDGTISIRNFRSGGKLYTNVPIEHNAISQQQPVKGQHVLFFTTGVGAQHLIKVVRLYGSIEADQPLVLNSPIDLDQGEGRMISQTGATVYVANGALYLGSCGQSITLLDEEQLTEVLCKNLDIITKDGFEIKKGEDQKLIIQKGTYTINGDTQAISDPTVVITIDGDTVTIEAKTIKLGANASEPAVLGTQLQTWLEAHTHATGVGPSGPPMSVPMPPAVFSVKNKVE